MRGGTYLPFLSTTVVLGFFFAVDFFTYRPVIADRALPLDLLLPFATLITSLWIEGHQQGPGGPREIVAATSDDMIKPGPSLVSSW